MELLNVSLRLLFSFFFHVTLLLSPVVDSSTLGNTTDRLALLAFKQQIIHASSQVLTTWNDSLHFCQWGGVICSRHHHQRVVGLNLTGMGLVGSISPFIGNLSFLRAIDLTNNKLFGEIPIEISRLLRLRYLSLSQNSMGGEIPANLTRCRGLGYIFLNYNQLIGRIPPELGSLSNLKMLHLGKNNLTGRIPPSFGNLSSLTNLILLYNWLEGNIPEELGRIPNLTVLQISANDISGTIPPAIYNTSSFTVFAMGINRLYGSLPPNLGLTLPNLVEFVVPGNKLTGPIPVSLSNASRLQMLEFGANNFSGSIPLNIGSLQSLTYLNMEDNYLGSGEAEDMSFLTSLANCSLLSILSLDGNRLIGAVPNSIANLSTHLTQLLLDGNQLFGSIPTEIGNLFNLIVLRMEANLLTGMIPVGIGKLNKLQVLTLHINKLSGQIPTSLGNNTNLYQLDLHKNSLQGSVPSSLEKCRGLSELHLSRNFLTGTIPKQVLTITTLRILNVKLNSLTGSLPTEVGNLKSLQTLFVSENKLSGEIPSTLDNCQSLEYLYIDGNLFHGVVPPLSSVKGILQMDLSRNNLSGRIPDYFAKFHDLQYLNLSFNNFEGEVPREGIFKILSAISVIGNRKLCGGTPELLLPMCISNDIKKKRRRLAPRITISIVISSILFLLFLSIIASFYYQKRKSKKNPSSKRNSFEDQFPNISFQDLFKATDGFSSANLVGAGSHGFVYKGYLDRVETAVAVKVLNLQQQGAFKSFIAECEALRNIRHRNLVKVLTACSSIDFKGDEFKALVFEYMTNGNLEQWLHPDADEQHQSRNLSFIQRLNIAIDVASALDYLHHCCQKSIVHCDLKPSNVLLDEDMNAHVGDFGLARFLFSPTSNSSQNQTSSIGIRGTIGYVAPEYGMGGEVSTRGDVYSYGILLLEIFTGKKPTDNMFKESLNLHQFAKMALVEQVTEIVDPHLLLREVESVIDTPSHNNVKSTLEKCLVSVLTVGIACSTTALKDRMDIREVMREMRVIKNLFLSE